MCAKGKYIYMDVRVKYMLGHVRVARINVNVRMTNSSHSPSRGLMHMFTEQFSLYMTQNKT